MRERVSQKLVKSLRLSGRYHLRAQLAARHAAYGFRDATYGVSCAMEGEEFAALVFELGESLKSVPPRRNTSWVQPVSVRDVGHGEVGQGSIGVAVDRILVPDLSDSPKMTLEHERERIIPRRGRFPSLPP